MSAGDVDEYLRGVDGPRRAGLLQLRDMILRCVPEAEQVIYYQIPAFRVDGEAVAGFAAFKAHLSYLPFSGSVLGRVADDLTGYTMTRSSLHFTVEHPLSEAIVAKLVAVRLAEARACSR